MRLAYLMVAHERSIQRHIDRIGHDYWMQLLSRDIHAVRSCELVIADNIRELFDARLHDGRPMYLNDFPCLMPPFGEMFIEYSMPEHSYGGFIRSLLKPGEVSSRFPEAAQVMSISLWVNRMGQEPCSAMTFMEVALDARGVYLAHEIGTPHEEVTNTHVMSCVGPMLMAISFMHCKNVERQEPPVETLPKAKWHRRMKVPKLKFYTLQVEPMKKVLRTEGELETNGLKKALHICRGHFATYTDANPLFGRVTGTFWKPSHVRGALEHGAVVKDYAVSLGRG